MARMIPKRVLSAVARCGMHCARKTARRRAACGEITDFVNSPGIQTRRADDDGSEFRYGVATCVGDADLRASLDCASRAPCPRCLRVSRRVANRLAECDLVSILRGTEQHGAVWISMTVACAATLAQRPVAAKRSSIAASRRSGRTKRARWMRGELAMRHDRQRDQIGCLQGWFRRAAIATAHRGDATCARRSSRQKKTPAQGRGPGTACSDGSVDRDQGTKLGRSDTLAKAVEPPSTVMNQLPACGAPIRITSLLPVRIERWS